MTIYTIGHSTRPLADFIDLLSAHGIRQLADVRTVPRSRRHPHFSREALAVSLPAAGVAYRHFPGLGGLRKPRPDSRNSGWRVEGFRGYADYMETAEFEGALNQLIEWSRGSERAALPESATAAATPVPAATPVARPFEGPDRTAATPVARPFQGRDGTVIMCAEAVWWRCHRQLIADALVARGIEVRHISTKSSAPAHTLTDFARLNDQRVSYPGLIS